MNDEPLLVRIGISCGDADVDEGDYFGVPVGEAARPCDSAEGGKMLACRRTDRQFPSQLPSAFFRGPMTIDGNSRKVGAQYS